MSTTATETSATATDTGQGTQQPAEQTQTTATPADVAAQQQATQQTQDPAPAGDNPWADPDKAKAEIERLRRENGAERTTAKQQAADQARTELLASLSPALKALGLDIPGDEQVTPEALAEQARTNKADADKARDDAREARVELAVFRRADTHSADAQALLDSRTFLAKVADLDPSSDDFGSKLDDAIKTAVSDNPKLKAAPVVGSSSADHAGGSGEGAVTQEAFDKMSGAERNHLHRTNPALYAQLSGRA
ncbi:hypothetical protein [Serinicoccus sediminis]|uniref:hypothetical protein n=1 Tax=Serinicoccus sediminis TaxID=2306021 RepID=UPI00101F1071|nr:hypothetical protein [Serinicoccus sediminis]